MTATQFNLLLRAGNLYRQLLLFTWLGMSAWVESRHSAFGCYVLRYFVQTAIEVDQIAR